MPVLYCPMVIATMESGRMDFLMDKEFTYTPVLATVIFTPMKAFSRTEEDMAKEIRQ